MGTLMQITGLRKILCLLCPALTSFCLMIGYLQLGVGMAAGAGLAVLLVWLVVHRQPVPWKAGLGLAVSTAAAVIGVTSGASPAWMIVSATLGLATWDLFLLDGSLANSSPSIPIERLEKAHYSSLGLALGSGLLTGLVGRMIHFRLPFLFMLVLVALAYLALDRLLRALTHSS